MENRKDEWPKFLRRAKDADDANSWTSTITYHIENGDLQDTGKFDTLHRSNVFMIRSKSAPDILPKVLSSESKEDKSAESTTADPEKAAGSSNESLEPTKIVSEELSAKSSNDETNQSLEESNGKQKSNINTDWGMKVEPKLNSYRKWRNYKRDRKITAVNRDWNNEASNQDWNIGTWEPPMDYPPVYPPMPCVQPMEHCATTYNNGTTYYEPVNNGTTYYEPVNNGTTYYQPVGMMQPPMAFAPPLIPIVPHPPLNGVPIYSIMPTDIIVRHPPIEYVQPYGQPLNYYPNGYY